MLALLSHTDPTTRLFAIIARDVRSAVVFRRGPSKQVRMLLWDLVRDELIGGQWLAGRIYEDRCGLSPNGKLLVYFAGKFGTKLSTFTAVCRPPYFTALALWPDGGTYGGGGFFEGNKKVVLNYGYVPKELNGGSGIPKDFEIGCVSDYRERPRIARAESNHGFALKSKGVDGESTSSMRVTFAKPWVFEKPNPAGSIVLERSWLGMFEVNGPNSVYSYRLVEVLPDGARKAAAAVDLGRLDWADWDHDGSLLYSEAGRLFRRAAATRLDRALPSPKLVADLRGQVFQNVVAPAKYRAWP